MSAVPILSKFVILIEREVEPIANNISICYLILISMHRPGAYLVLYPINMKVSVELNASQVLVFIQNTVDPKFSKYFD